MSVQKCPRCGTALFADAPEGLCPRCLVALHFLTDTEIGEENGRNERKHARAEEPPSLEEVTRLFPQFEILKSLGCGGMGVVYQARQARLDRIVALKILPKGKQADPHFAARFEREARALARLNHPNIVAVYEFGDTGGHYYLVLEFVDGVNLRLLLRAGKLTPEQALGILPGICDALQYAHGRGVVHRDIKPENILLDQQGHPKLADFGIAKLLQSAPKDLLLTEVNQVIGTPHYMAPEQVERPQVVDHRADLYSLGVVFYEMLMGELPLGNFTLPSKRALDVRLDQVVLHALEKDPGRRYQQAAELKADLAAIATGKRSDTNSTISPQTSGPLHSRWQRPGRQPMWSSLAAVLVLGVITLLFFSWSRLGSQWFSRKATHVSDIVFPPDSGVVDLTQAPYSIKGDGVTDSTAAIQQALADHHGRHAILYFPKGTYLISDTLRWVEGTATDGSGHKRVTLQGQSRTETILRLKDHCPGFTDTSTPKPMIWTGPKGEDKYFNSLRALTVDTGRDNPGAIGVQFNANWVGCLRDVNIRAGDGRGVTGLDMAYPGAADSIGPLLVKNITIQGFNVGIHTKGVLLSQTFEHLSLEDQGQVSFLNEGQSVSIRDLRTTGRVPAFRNLTELGLAVIVDAKLHGSGEAKSQPALINRPGMFVRNVSVDGFAHAITHLGSDPTNIPGPFVKEWTSRNLPNSKPSLNLPVKETPEVPWDPPSEWANVARFTFSPDRWSDDGDAIQRAIDSGKRTVYLPRGEYAIRQPILLRGRVARLIGCEAVLHMTPPDPLRPMLTLVEGEAPVVVVERLSVVFRDSAGPHRFMDNLSRRTLVLRDCMGVESEFTGPGELFLENVAARFVFHGQSVWARQLNQLATSDMPPEQWWHLRNQEGRLWILGEMTEGPGPVVITTGSGKTEVLGGLLYSNAAAKEQPEPAFLVEQGALSVSINEVNVQNITYPVLVRRVAKGEKQDLLVPSQAGGGFNGSLIPHFSVK